MTAPTFLVRYAADDDGTHAHSHMEQARYVALVLTAAGYPTTAVLGIVSPGACIALHPTEDVWISPHDAARVAAIATAATAEAVDLARGARFQP